MSELAAFVGNHSGPRGEEDPEDRAPRFDLLALALGLLTAALLLRLCLLSYGQVWGPPPPPMPHPVAVDLGPVTLTVPSNTIRMPVQTGAPVSSLELLVHWPTLEGYSDARADAFQSTDDRSPLLFLSIRPAEGRFGPNERYDHVYRRILVDFPRIGPGGLVAQSFRAGFGYDGETLYVSPLSGQPFVARCAAEETSAATCLVEYRSAHGLDVAYRFRRSLLSRWRAIDRSVRTLVDGFVAASPEP